MKRLMLVLTLLALVAGWGSASPNPTPVAAQQTPDVTWKAEFFNNAYLLGEPVVTKFYDAINFNWREGSPDPAVNPNNFSVRFTTDTFIPGGTYRFQVRADDGVSIGIDSRRILDRINNPNVDQIHTVDERITNDVHKIQVDYRELGGFANITLNWFNLADGEQPFPERPEEQTESVFISANWTAQYYNNQTLSGSPVLTRIENGPDINWGTGSPAGNIAPDSFSVRWSKVQTLNAGTYRLVVEADDGVRVWFNNTQYIDEWHNWANQTYTREFTISGGTYPIIVEYYEDYGSAFINLDLVLVYAQAPQPQPPGVVTQPGSNTNGNTTNPPDNIFNAPVAVDTAVRINAERLNVRITPQVQFGNILTQVSEGQYFPYIAQTPDQQWIQINVNGRPGWVNARYVTVTNQLLIRNPANNSNNTTTTTNPPTNTGSVSAPFTTTGTTLGEVNVRSGPGIGYRIVDRVDQGDTVTIVGRTADSTWWRVQVDGQLGWMSARWVRAETTNTNALPIAR